MLDVHFAWHPSWQCFWFRVVKPLQEHQALDVANAYVNLHGASVTVAEPHEKTLVQCETMLILDVRRVQPWTSFDDKFMVPMVNLVRMINDQLRQDYPKSCIKIFKP